MTEPKSDHDHAAAGTVINSFLNDATVKGAIEKLHLKYYKDFRIAKNAEEREAVAAASKALDDLSGELMAISNAGHQAATRIERAEQQEAREKAVEERRRRPSR